ncbi:MAG: DUF501 domain-containing protein [Actinobacteria bacterium]|nr:DUF501 domain-containing protein [Actinomycetota bacterium]
MAPRLVMDADLAVVAGQLGRTPRAMSRVVARCPFAFPAAVETLPYDDGGRPFPTLFYLTCPTLVAAVSRLESDGGVRAWCARTAAEPALARAVVAASSSSRRRRRDLVRRYDLAMVDGGASLTAGVGGVGDVRAVKCLHAHVAHALARPGYILGRAVLAQVEEPWCGDRRCAAFAPPAEPSR